MKQAIFILIGCFFATTAFSQNTTTIKKAPPSSGAFFSSDQGKMLCKAWKLDTVSEFGVDTKATDKEANDGITFVADGSLFYTDEGIARIGTWAYAAARINTTLKSPDEKKSFKIISIADIRLILEYQTPDLIRVKYIYSPKK